MKQCPRCGRNYYEENLNFCLDDGELLTVAAAAGGRSADDSPPTVMFDEARRTNPANWPNTAPASPPAQWQQPSPDRNFTGYVMPAGPTQTLAVVSLGLGIGAMTIGWCCSLGLLLAPGGLITGFIALSQIKKDPSKYTGRGFAIGGIVTSAVFIAFYVMIMLIWGFSVFLGGR